MYFIFHTLRLLPKKSPLSRYQVLKSVAFRVRNMDLVQEKPLPRSQRFTWAIKMLSFPLTLPFRLRKTKAKCVIYETEPNRKENFLFWVNQVYGSDFKEEECLFMKPYQPIENLYYRELSLGKYLRIWFLTVKLAWYAAADFLFPSRIRPYWRLRLTDLLLQQLLFHKKDQDGQDQFFFRAYQPESYLSTLLASALLPDYTPWMSSSNSLSFRNNRYFYHPKTTFLICSRIISAEVATFTKIGWFQAQRILPGVLEEARIIDQCSREREDSIDIGLYSSGGWARKISHMREMDVERVRQTDPMSLPLYVWFLKILQAIIEVKKEHGYSVKLFLHPLEFDLMEQHEIMPPYLAMAEEAGIVIGKSRADSLNELFESKIGVGIASTILMDRVQYGKISFFYCGTELKFTGISAPHLGQFRKLGYTSPEELKSRIVEALSGNIREYVPEAESVPIKG